MSGHCDFCGVWHSGSCCHPGRVQLDQLRAERDAALDRLRAVESTADEYSAAVTAALHRAGKRDVTADAAIDAIAAERDAARALLSYASITISVVKGNLGEKTEARLILDELVERIKVALREGGR